jgi:formamidopyrimidine-DNA glycosylase
MPELPEVQTIVATLRPFLLNRPIGQVRLLRADILHPAGIEFASELHGRAFAEITRRGKKIVMTLDDGRSFYIHLGMSGRLTVEDSSTQLQKHTHLVISLHDKHELRFNDPRRFGGIWWIGDDYHPDTGLGPEALEQTAADLAERLSHTRRAIKTALLDQSILAGLGNIYADEALFAAMIHPLTPANRLSCEQVTALSGAIKRVLNRALKHKGSTLRDYRNADGLPGDFQKLHRVYDREGKPCSNCGTPIRRLVISGRSSCFCPVCQRMDLKTSLTPRRKAAKKN